MRSGADRIVLGGETVELEETVRPRYETEESLVQETQVLTLLCHHWECIAKKLPVRYELDYLLIRNRKAMGWLEIKVRAINYEYYPTYMISLGKVMAARKLTEATSLPSFLVVQWRDGKGYIRLDDLGEFEITMGGRTDREDDQDVEPVVLFPIQGFTQINEWQ
jgi:hypothetical protein